MKENKVLGIWMDYSHAFLTDLTNDCFNENNIQPNPEDQKTQHALSFENKYISKKEKENQSDYFKKISIVILNFQEVLIFGTKDAKKELSSILDCNSLFDNIKIELRETQKMTENQLLAFYK